MTDLARSRAKRLGGDPEGILGSNYRRRRAAAAEAAGQSRARGTVRESIIQGVYGLDDQTQACSSCDERQDKAREAVRAYASKVVERSRTKPKDKKPVFVTETVPNLTRPKKRPAAAQPESAEEKRRKKEQKKGEKLPVIVAGRQRGESLEREVRKQTYEYLRTKKKSEAAPRAEVEKKEEKKEERKEEKKKEKEAEAVSAAAAEESEYSEYSYTYVTLTPTSEEEEEREVPKRD